MRDKIKKFLWFKMWSRLLFVDVIARRYMQCLGVWTFSSLLKITKAKAQFTFTPEPAITLNGVTLDYDVRNRGNVLGMDIVGVWEPGDLAIIIDSLQNGGVFYDIGANVGWFSLNVALRCPEATVIAIDPYSGALKKNISLNKISGERIQVFSCALGAENTVVCMTDGLLSGNHVSKTGRPCRLRRLDDLIAEESLPDPKVIKIDVEGFEYQVLMGAERTIRRAKPLVLCEFTGLNSDEPQIEQMLANIGYRSPRGYSGQLVNKLFTCGADHPLLRN